MEFLNVEERSKGWICVVGRRPVAERSRRDRSAEAGRNFIVLSSFFDGARMSPRPCAVVNRHGGSVCRNGVE